MQLSFCRGRKSGDRGRHPQLCDREGEFLQLASYDGSDERNQARGFFVEKHVRPNSPLALVGVVVEQCREAKQKNSEKETGSGGGYEKT